VNPVVLYFASGELLYPGAALLLAAVATSSVKLPGVAFWLRRAAIWVGLALIVMACPPFPWIVDAGFTAAFLLWLISLNHVEPRWRWLRTGTSCVLIVFLLVLSVSEFYRRRLPVIEAKASDHLVVLGDSISAGLGGNVQPWPEVMQARSGVEVKNLSKPGATTADGVAMANHVGADDHLILIELGGNDLLAGNPSNESAQALESVLKKLSRPERMLVMFELPLMPQAIQYGRVQRRLAKKYGVALIPKRFFAAVISGKEATSDGLHLSQVGGDRMASLVARVLFSHAAQDRSATTLSRHP
jgi:acyl-CoA thioesterase I